MKVTRTNKTVVIATPENTTIERTADTHNLKWYCEQYQNVTLNDLSKATGGNVTVMRTKAKEPVVGEVYDPEKVNYSAVEDYLFKRNPNLRWEALDWETMNAPKEKVSRTLVLDYRVGAVYFIKRLDNREFKIVYTTETHVCIVPCGERGDTILRTYHKDTFKAYSPQLLGTGLLPASYDGDCGDLVSEEPTVSA